MKNLTPIQFRDGTIIPVLHEDRSVLAIDKPAGWMLAPERWTRTSRNLQTALADSIRAGDFWARARKIKFLRYLHRLDADTSGVLLLARNAGVISAYSRLFAERLVTKLYLAVVQGVPARPAWTCSLRLTHDPRNPELMRVDPRHGQEAETNFRVLDTQGNRSLIEANPLTGRTHQIRVHLTESGHPVVGDPWYGPVRREPSATRPADRDIRLALRAIVLAYRDPFRRCPVRIEASTASFLKEFGWKERAGQRE